VHCQRVFSTQLSSGRQSSKHSAVTTERAGKEDTHSWDDVGRMGKMHVWGVDDKP